MSPKPKLIPKDTKTTCGCGRTVLWKYVPSYGYVRTNESGEEKHICPPRLN